MNGQVWGNDIPHTIKTPSGLVEHVTGSKKLNTQDEIGVIYYLAGLQMLRRYFPQCWAIAIVSTKGEKSRYHHVMCTSMFDRSTKGIQFIMGSTKLQDDEYPIEV